MSEPFHFSFLVRDLESTRRFYGEVLGCREGHRHRHAGISFLLEPQIRFPGGQATMFLPDPARNALELKGFRDPENAFRA